MEKKGWTEKRIYDFNSSALLEVFINNKWFRVTCEDFRSFDGDRRISHWRGDEKIITSYDGPVYFYRTNKIAPKNNSNKIQHLYTERNEVQSLKNRDLKSRKNNIFI